MQKTYFSGGSSYTVALFILVVSAVRGRSSSSLWSSPAKDAGVRGMSMVSQESMVMSWFPLLSRVPGTLRAIAAPARDFRLLGLLCIVLYWVSREGGSRGWTGTWKPPAGLWKRLINHNFSCKNYNSAQFPSFFSKVFQKNGQLISMIDYPAETTKSAANFWRFKILWILHWFGVQDCPWSAICSAWDVAAAGPADLGQSLGSCWQVRCQYCIVFWSSSHKSIGHKYCNIAITIF